MTISIDSLTVTKHYGNPVLSPTKIAGSQDYYGIRNQIGFYENGIYYLFYSQQSTATVYDPYGYLGIAYSNNRINWTKANIKALPLGGVYGSTGSFGGSGWIVKSNGIYYLYLVYDPATGSLGTVLATATNILGPWTYYNNGTPIISTTTDFCPNSAIAAPPESGYAWMMFGCRVASSGQIRCCYSNDLVTWTTPTSIISVSEIANFRIENFYVFKVGVNWFGVCWCYGVVTPLSAIAGDPDSNGPYLYQASNTALTAWSPVGWLWKNSGNGTDWDWASNDLPGGAVFVHGDKVDIFYNGGQGAGNPLTEFGIGRSIGFTIVSGFPLPSSPMPTFFP